MENDGRRHETERSLTIQDDLREQVAKALERHAGSITSDTIAGFPGAEGLDHDSRVRVGELLLRLLISTIRDGAIDDRDALIAGLRAAVRERSIPAQHLFTCAYLIERGALDELALDESIGAMSEAWPLVAQLVRRGSFEYLASFTARARTDRGEPGITDEMTTLHTRRVFDAVLLKEAERSGRFGYPLALILFDVDRLSALNERYGYGVGNRILERLGVLMRKYFRQHDWVARYGDDEIAVLLTAVDAERAAELAEQARAMVEERLRFPDHITDRPVSVTVTGSVVSVPAAIGAAVDPERLLIEAESALTRAKRAGRNRIELASAAATTRALPRSLPST